MLCYKDKTFCPSEFYKTCGAHDSAHPCPRALTPAVQAAADAWWGGSDAPVALFLERPDCHLHGSEREGMNASS